MIKIDCALAAEKPVEAVQNQLSELGFGIEKYVVARETDAASVMVKFGRIIDCQIFIT